MLEKFLKRMNKAKNQKGFTLVELIVVIAILGILAAVAVGRFGGFTEKARLSSDYATAATIASAAEVYRSETGEWPADIANLNSEGYLDKDKYTAQAKALKGDMVLVKTAGTAGTADKITVTANSKVIYPKPEVDPVVTP